MAAARVLDAGRKERGHAVYIPEVGGHHEAGPRREGKEKEGPLSDLLCEGRL